MAGVAVVQSAARAYTPATTGDATEVPPKTIQPLAPVLSAVLSYTATPVFGSAIALTSATALRLQPVLTLLCQLALVLYDEHPLPAPLHAVSVQPRAFVDVGLSEVPPTAMTLGSEAG